jgi:hypothetical protein
VEPSFLEANRKKLRKVKALMTREQEIGHCKTFNLAGEGCHTFFAGDHDILYTNIKKTFSTRR